MANLTITVNEDVLKRARIRALEQGTSVNAVLGEYLSTYVGDLPSKQAIKEIIELARGAKSSSGKGKRSWTRDDIYER
jgi:hypothetical protein